MLLNVRRLDVVLLTVLVPEVLLTVADLEVLLPKVPRADVAALTGVRFGAARLTAAAILPSTFTSR